MAFQDNYGESLADRLGGPHNFWEVDPEDEEENDMAITVPHEISDAVAILSAAQRAIEAETSYIDVPVHPGWTTLWHAHDWLVYGRIGMRGAEVL